MSELSKNSLKNLAMGNHWSSNTIRDMALGRSSAIDLFEKHMSASRGLHNLIERELETTRSFRQMLEMESEKANAFKKAMEDSFSASRNFTKLFEPTTLDIAKSFFATNSIHDSFAKIGSIHETIGSLSNGFSAVKELQASMAGLDGVSKILQKEFQAARHVQDFISIDRSLFEQVSNSLRPLDDALEGTQLKKIIGTADDALDAVIEQVSKSSNKSPVEIRQLFVFFFTFVLPLLALWRAELLAQQSSEELKAVVSHIDSKLTTLEEALSQLQEKINQRSFYKVKRAVWMVEEERFTSAKVQLLLPGQTVEVLDHNQKWVYIAAFDTSDGQTKEGYVLKKYLTRMNKMGVNILPYLQLGVGGVADE